MKKGVFTLVLWVIWASSAYALGGVEVTAGAGYQWGNGIVIEERAIQNDDFAIGTATMSSTDFKIGVPVSKRLQVELLFSRHDTQLEDKDSLFGVQPGGFFPPPEYDETTGELIYGGKTHLLDMTAKYWHLGVVYELNEGAARAFVAAGAGITQLEFNLPLPASRRFSASLGLGVKQDLSRWFGLRLEGRYFYTDTDESQAVTEDYSDVGVPECSEPCTYTYRYDDYLLQGDISLGLVFRLAH